VWHRRPIGKGTLLLGMQHQRLGQQSHVDGLVGFDASDEVRVTATAAAL